MKSTDTFFLEPIEIAFVLPLFFYMREMKWKEIDTWLFRYMKDGGKRSTPSSIHNTQSWDEKIRIIIQVLCSSNWLYC